MRPPARINLKDFAARMPWALCLLILGGWGHLLSADELSVRILTADGHPLSGAVVTVQPLDAPAHHPLPQRTVIDQINRSFAPDLIVIPVGSTVEFPNSDPIAHQIYSFSPAKRFQLPLYRGKPYPPVLFDQAGIVTLGCNIHDQMLAYVVVTDAPYFGRTDASGRWSVDVGHGQYRANIWHPRLQEAPAALEQRIQVTDTGRAELTFQLSKALRPARLSQSPHSWDY
jgi:plastocyanin